MADSQRKTANLFDGVVRNAIINDSTGEETPNANWRCSNFIEVSAEKVTLSWTSDSQFYQAKLGYYEADDTFISTETIQGYYYSGTFTLPNNCKHIKISYSVAVSGSQVTRENIMLNEGSQPLPFEPYSSTGWYHSLRELKTATETIQSGDTIYADGTAATVSLKGNTVQNGTPTPSNPVEVNGVGVRTENLFDWATVTTGYRIAWATGALIQDEAAIMSDFIPVSAGAYRANASFNLAGYAADKSYLGVYDPNSRSFRKEYGSRTSYYTISDTNVAYVKLVSFSTTDTLSASTTLNTGSTAKPFEPYGYKIPISSANTTTPVYLGEVETTRKIKKLVLTGQEDWQEGAAARGEYRFYLQMSDSIQSDTTVGVKSICTHFELASTGNTYNLNNSYTISVDQKLFVKKEADTRLAGFKQWLADQYANGTPVTVWYVLAEPETAVVNEPLMKIGTYADSISNAASIPTVDGANTITVDTTVQPSEVSATYTGWHDSSVKEWDGTDWN
jgi:hypothetical protein